MALLVLRDVGIELGEHVAEFAGLQCAAPVLVKLVEHSRESGELRLDVRPELLEHRAHLARGAVGRLLANHDAVLHRVYQLLVCHLPVRVDVHHGAEALLLRGLHARHDSLEELAELGGGE